MSANSSEKPSKTTSNSTAGPQTQRDSTNSDDNCTIIHVCDEARGLKQDFSCPRELLVLEMGFFASFLADDNEEDYDISVHCEIGVFDWLMRYVKRHIDEENEKSLAVDNVISILIAADYLKMNALVSQCIRFIAENFNKIVDCPSNLNCVSDTLVSQLAKQFTAAQLESLVDRKDKLKSKLYAHKLDDLFSSDRPGGASTLFQCKFCRRYLTEFVCEKLPCHPERFYLNREQQLCFEHQRDPDFNVDVYLSELKQRSHYVLSDGSFSGSSTDSAVHLSRHSHLNALRHVYWRVWATVNCLRCSCCDLWFQLTELDQCRYHPYPVVYPNDSNFQALSQSFPPAFDSLEDGPSDNPEPSNETAADEDNCPTEAENSPEDTTTVKPPTLPNPEPVLGISALLASRGRYGCCKTTRFRFEPMPDIVQTPLWRGCKTRDHILVDDGTCRKSSEDIDEMELFETAVKLRHIIGIPRRDRSSSSKDSKNSDADSYTVLHGGKC